jgi:hypothetical protein
MSKLIFIKKNSYLLVLFGAVLAVAPARAAIVTLTFTGTYDNLTFQGVSTFAGWSTSGLTSIPFSYSLTYDTSLNASNASVVTAGSVVGLYNHVASHDMYGYTSSGLLSVTKTLGNLSWSVADLNPITPFGGAVGDLWFDVDISQATPTKSWVEFGDSGNPASYFSNIGQGMVTVVGSTDYLLFEPSTRIERTDGMRWENVRTTSAPSITSSVPEPSALSLLAVGLGGWAMARRRLAESKGFR